MCRDRPSYRDIDYDGSDRQGDYRMYGELSRVGDYEGGYGADIIDSRRYDRDRYYDRDYRSFRAGVNKYDEPIIRGTSLHCYTGYVSL